MIAKPGYGVSRGGGLYWCERFGKCHFRNSVLGKRHLPKNPSLSHYLGDISGE